MSKESKKISKLKDMLSIAPLLGGLIIGVGIYLFFSTNLPASFCFGLFIFALVLIVVTQTMHTSNEAKAIEMKYKGMKIANIDAMSGIDFEQYLERLLIDQGYIVEVTPVSGDLGVDLVALQNENRIAIQAKRFSSKVSRRAVSDAVAGMNYYKCNKAMVITNSYFSDGAIALAEATGCILVDRDMLADWINEFQNKNFEVV